MAGTKMLFVLEVVLWIITGLCGAALFYAMWAFGYDWGHDFTGNYWYAGPSFCTGLFAVCGVLALNINRRLRK